MDRYNFTSFGRLKTLVVPINDCSSINFQRYYDLLRPYNEIRLLDITPKPQLQYFNPQTFPNGRIFYDFTTSIPDSDTIFLHDFEPYRKTFVILGVGSYSDDINCHEILNRLTKKYPSSPIHNLIIFDSPDDKLHQMTNQVFYHKGTNINNILALETILCDVAGNFLEALDSYASSYSNITLRSPVSITNTHTLTKTINQAQKRLSSGSTSFKAAFNTSSPIQDPKSKTQLKHNGRQAKIMGDFYLLAGKYLNAYNCFLDSLANLRKSEDFLWLGSSLEGLAVSIILLHYCGSNYELPRQKLCQILQISIKKLPVMTPSNLDTQVRALSSESVRGNGNSANSIKSPRSSSTFTNQNLTSSPRNSVSSYSSVGDISNLALPELIRLILSKALQYYQLSTDDYENMVPDIVYVESILRLIKFMVAIFLGGNTINKMVLENIVRGNHYSTQINLENTYFLKTDILKETDKIFLLQLTDLSIIEQCRIFCTLATIYSDLGLSRKKAFILRILLVSLVPKLESSLNQNEEIGENLLSIGFNPTQKSNVREIFAYLFEIYGIPLDNEPLTKINKNWTSLQIPLLKLGIRISESVKDYQFVLTICTILLSKFTHCLGQDSQQSIKDKIDSLMHVSNSDGLKLSTHYWDPFLVRKVKIINNRNKDDLLPFPEYLKSAGNIGLVGSSQPSNVAKKVEPFFDPFNKSKVKVMNRDVLLIKDEIYYLEVQFQNPFFFEIEIEEINIVTEGSVEVQTLNNLTKALTSTMQGNIYSQKALGILSKVRNNGKRAISASPAPSANQSSSSISASALVILPQSSDSFQIAFKPLQIGELKIIGFRARVSDCEEQFFSIYDSTFNVKHDLKLTIQNSEEENFEPTSKPNLTSNALAKSLFFKVIPPQPNLCLTDLLVTNSWLMLLEGEKYSFSIHLRNYSTELINFLSFSFWDSTIEPLTKRLDASSGNQSLSASEVYELEWLLLKSNPFKILNKEEIVNEFQIIDAQGYLRIDFEITGKRGMKELKVILEYAHKHVDDLSNSFVKSVQIPLNLSIFPSLEVVSCDILPLYSFSFKNFAKKSQIQDRSAEKIIQFVENLENVSDYCLMILDIKNIWNDELIAKIDYLNTNFTFEAFIKPNKTQRFLIPIKRISSGDIDVTAPIPSLRKKQFVKNYSITEEEDQKMRQLFWTRANLLDNLTGSWRISSSKSSRQGNIDFRNIRLTSRMSHVLMHEKLTIINTILQDCDGEPVKRDGNICLLKVDEFYTLKTTITNDTSNDFNGILRHLPFPMSALQSLSTNAVIAKNQMSIERKILVNGILQRHLGHDGVKAGQKLELSMSFVIIEKGDYEWGTVLDVFGNCNLVSRESIIIHAS